MASSRYQVVLRLVLCTVLLVATMLVSALVAKPAAAKPAKHHHAGKGHGKKHSKKASDNRGVPVSQVSPPEGQPSTNASAPPAGAAPPSAGGQVYTAYGDSMTYGYGTNFPYPKFYVGSIAADTKTPTNLTNFGYTGVTSSEQLAILRTNPAKESNRSSRVITVGVGLNDLLSPYWLYYRQGACGGEDNQDCLRSAVTAFEANYEAIMDEVFSSCSSEGTSFRLQNEYDPLLHLYGSVDSFANDGGLKDGEVLHRYVDEMEEFTKRIADERGVPLADTYSRFNGESGREDPYEKGWMQSDQLHPNEIGNIVIADELRKLGFKRNCFGPK